MRILNIMLVCFCIGITTNVIAQDTLFFNDLTYGMTQYDFENSLHNSDDWRNINFIDINDNVPISKYFDTSKISMHTAFKAPNRNARMFVVTIYENGHMVGVGKVYVVSDSIPDEVVENFDGIQSKISSLLDVKPSGNPVRGGLVVSWGTDKQRASLYMIYERRFNYVVVSQRMEGYGAFSDFLLEIPPAIVKTRN